MHYSRVCLSALGCIAFGLCVSAWASDGPLYAAAVRPTVSNLLGVSRVMQFYNTVRHNFCPYQGTEDDFCPGAI